MSVFEPDWVRGLKAKYGGFSRFTRPYIVALALDSNVV